MKKKRIFLIGILLIICIVIILVIQNNKKQDNNNIIYTIDEILGKTIEDEYICVKDREENTFYIPKGFRISEIESEQLVNNGVVIIDNTNEDTNGSEFVWIPAENEGVDNLKDKFKLDDLVEADLYTQTGDEYTEVLESIANFKGFYIARYEMGLSEKLEKNMIKNNYIENGRIVEDTTKYASDKFKPVSKSNVTVWTHIKFNEEDKGAIVVSNNMYSESSFKSTLCYGIQWDAILSFIDFKSINDTKQVGNYSEEITKSGNNINYCLKNIYDLAGNVSEWTIENYADELKVARGGSSLNMQGIESRNSYYSTDEYRDLGFRVALILK